MNDHAAELAIIRGRQLAMIQLLPAVDALAVLTAAPIDDDEDHAIVADLLQRQLLAEHLSQQEEANP